MSQLKAWEKEYTKIRAIPTTTRQTPSSAVVSFLDFCRQHNIQLGQNVLDIGAGTGRNLIYLAKLGFSVTGVEFADPAIAVMLSKVRKNQLRNVKVIKADIAEKLPFSNATFEWAIDIVTTVSLDDNEIVKFEKELYRIIKPNGLFLTYVHSPADEYLKDKVNEDGFYKVPELGLVERIFTKQKLLQIYSRWELVALEQKSFKDRFLDRTYTRTLWWGIFRRPKNPTTL